MGPLLLHRAKTEGQYFVEVDRFLNFLGPNIELLTYENADEFAHSYIEAMYVEGAPKTRATNIVAGLKYPKPAIWR